MFGMLVLELNSHCNRACSWCMRHGDRKGRRFSEFGDQVRATMPTEQCERMLKEAAEAGFRSWVTFYLMSEPYLDERLVPMARLARSLGMKPFVNTNGDVLRKRPDLLDASREVFEFVQVGIYVSGAQAQTDIARWKARLGTVAQFKTLDQMGPRPHVARVGKTFPAAPCARPKEKLIVQYDGSCPLCCYDINTEFGLPNAFDIPLLELWNHPLREALACDLSKANGRRSYPLCSTCPMPERGFPDPFGDP